MVRLMRSGVWSAVAVAVLGAGVAFSAGPAEAEGLRLQSSSSKSRAALFSNQTRLMDTRLAKQYDNSARFRPGGAKTALLDAPEATVLPRYSGRYKGQYLSHAKAMARKHGIPESLFLRLVQQESGWNPSARSHAGATGLAQLMPGTARKLGVDPQDPHENLEGGARYLRMMYNRFGSWKLALAAYNAGPEAVQKHGGVPPYRETKQYVLAILGG